MGFRAMVRGAALLAAVNVVGVPSAALSCPSGGCVAGGLYDGGTISCSNGVPLYSANGDFHLKCAYGGYVPTTQGLTWELQQREEGVTDFQWRSGWDPNFSQGGQGYHMYQYAVASSSATAVMQNDGNFVLYASGTSNPVWSTSTYGNSGAWLNVQDDGNLVIYTSSNVPLWSKF